MPASTIEKYLNKYSEQHTEVFANMPGLYSHCIVIPAFNETSQTLQTFLNFLNSITEKTILIIWVVNAHDQAPSEVIHTNKGLIEHFKQRGKTIWKSNLAKAQLIKLTRYSHAHFLVLDYSTIKSDRLHHKQGVGIARKIGADIALQLIQKEIITTPWIHNTDADATLPSDYFNFINATRNNHQADKKALVNAYAAITHPFIHYYNTSGLAIHGIAYEQFIRYYQAALSKAGSPYDFFSIGSIISVNAKHYAMVRGFPKKSAGEDFYLLNKLAKTGKISPTKGMPIRLQGRLSQRTPYGTGATLANRSTSNNHQLFYHPEIFNCLERLLADVIEKIGNDVKPSAQSVSSSMPDKKSKELVQTFLFDLKLDDQIQKLFKNFITSSHRKKHFHQWFDGFKTLKFIHFMRNSLYESICIDVLMKSDFYEQIETKEMKGLRIQYNKLDRDQNQPT